MSNSIGLTWIQFKALSIQRGLPMMYFIDNNHYFIFLVDGSLSFEIRIRIASPAPDGSNQEDFEDNFKDDIDADQRPAGKSGRMGFLECIEELSPVITIVGRAINLNAAMNDPVWQIWMIIKLGILTQIIWAEKNGKKSSDFIYTWDERADLFPPLPYTNIFAVNFNGTDGEMLVEHHSSLDFERTDPMTISAWVNADDLLGSQTIVDKEANDATLRGYALLLNESRLRFIVRSNNLTTNRLTVETPTGQFINGKYYHVLVTYDGSSSPSGVKFYINAVLKTNEIITDTLTETIKNIERLRIGRRSLGDAAFDGKIDEVSIFDKVLSLLEVGEIYNAGDPNNLLEHSAIANLVSYWGMGDSRLFPIVPDRKGTNHGTLINLIEDDVVQEVP